MFEPDPDAEPDETGPMTAAGGESDPHASTTRALAARRPTRRTAKGRIDRLKVNVRLLLARIATGQSPQRAAAAHQNTKAPPLLRLRRPHEGYGVGLMGHCAKAPPISVPVAFHMA